MRYSISFELWDTLLLGIKKQPPNADSSCRSVCVFVVSAYPLSPFCARYVVLIPQFRADLYFRLKVVVDTVPPLRERKVEILPLAEGFLAYYSRKYRKDAWCSESAEKILQGYRWPGNVRELENLVQGLV